MLVSHYRHLEQSEGMPFGRELVVRGSEERLAPILMTALATGLALVPIVLGGSRAGYEIEHPLAVVILGGLVTSTLLNLFIVPALYSGSGGPRNWQRNRFSLDGLVTTPVTSLTLEERLPLAQETLA